jgi:hypothetical protein
MMRRFKAGCLLIIVCLGFISLLVYSPKVYSQDVPENVDIYKKHSLNKEVYRNTHSEYLLKRTQYLKFRTLKSQTDVREATVAMLSARDEVVISYLEILKGELDRGVGVSDSERSILSSEIERGIDWHREHKGKLPSAGSLEDLVVDSSEARDQYAFIALLHRKVSAVLLSGKVGDFESRTLDVYARVKEKLAEVKSKESEEDKFSDKKLQIIDRWIFEGENKVVRGQDKRTLAKSLVSSLFALEQKEEQKNYNLAVSSLGEALLFFGEAGSYVSEVVRQIKIVE